MDVNAEAFPVCFSGVWNVGAGGVNNGERGCLLAAFRVIEGEMGDF